MRKRLLSKLGGTTKYRAKKMYSTAGKRNFSSGTRVGTPVRSGAISKFSSAAYRKGEEIKTFDVRFSGAYSAGTYTVDTEPCEMTPINGTTQVVQALNLTQQGAGMCNRIGNKISLKSLRLRLFSSATGKSTAAGAAPTVRIMVIYDRNTNNSYPALNSILGYSRQDNTVQSGNFSDNINPNLMDRYVVMMDCWVELQSTAATGPGNSTASGCLIDKYINLKDLETKYTLTSNPGVIANVAIGGLYLCVWGDPLQVINTSDAWQLYGTARLRFRDN